MLEFPVNPIKLLSNNVKNFLIFSGVSLSGSTDTKRVFSLKYYYSGVFLINSNALLNLYKLYGQTSGQLQKPK